MNSQAHSVFDCRSSTSSRLLAVLISDETLNPFPNSTHLNHYYEFCETLMQVTSIEDRLSALAQPISQFKDAASSDCIVVLLPPPFLDPHPRYAHLKTLNP